MQNNDTPTQKDIAREHCHDASFVGLDADGASHYWSQYYETIIVVDGSETEIFELDDTPCQTLGDWRRHVEHKRGWTDCRIGGSLVGDLVDGMEAAQ